ncbi:UAA transporter [Tulasnella sp. 332]|nr:UAA transporter [Tulasnella sp. 332]
MPVIIQKPTTPPPSSPMSSDDSLYPSPYTPFSGTTQEITPTTWLSIVPHSDAESVGMTTSISPRKAASILPAPTYASIPVGKAGGIPDMAEGTMLMPRTPIRNRTTRNNSHPDQNLEPSPAHKSNSPSPTRTEGAMSPTPRRNSTAVALFPSSLGAASTPKPSPTKTPTRASYVRHSQTQHDPKTTFAVNIKGLASTSVAVEQPSFRHNSFTYSVKHQRHQQHRVQTPRWNAVPFSQPPPLPLPPRGNGNEDGNDVRDGGAFLSSPLTTHSGTPRMKPFGLSHAIPPTSISPKSFSFCEHRPTRPLSPPPSAPPQASIGLGLGMGIGLARLEKRDALMNSSSDDGYADEESTTTETATNTEATDGESEGDDDKDKEMDDLGKSLTVPTLRLDGDDEVDQAGFRCAAGSKKRPVVQMQQKQHLDLNHYFVPVLQVQEKYQAPPPYSDIQHIPPPSHRPRLTIIPPPSLPVRSISSTLTPTLTSTPFILSLYFCFNLGLTLYNKGVLVKFPFPYTLTALHAFCGTLGTMWLWWMGYFIPARLTLGENMTLSFFSILYTLNIAVSNLSLQLVTIPFHQVVRASAPLFTITIAYLMSGRSGRSGKGFMGVGRKKLGTLVPVMIGVGFATYGDYYFTKWGLILTIMGTFLAALKTVITNKLQTTTTISRRLLPSTPPLTPTLPSHHTFDYSDPKSPYRNPANAPPTTSVTASSAPSRFKLHPLDLLLRMSPLAFVQCVVYAYLSGEMERVASGAHLYVNPKFGNGGGSIVYGSQRMMCLALFGNGLIAFGLNVVSFTANKRTGPLTMTVAANIKQVLTILLAVVIFNVRVSPTNVIGIFLTLAGGMWYAAIEYEEKERKKRSAALNAAIIGGDRGMFGGTRGCGEREKDRLILR